MFRTKVWKECFCAFCKNERKIYSKKHLGFSEVLLVGVLSFLLSMVFWQEVEPRSMVVFVAMLVVSETIVHFRYRFGVICQHCGFDPILYKRNKQAACNRVKSFMQFRKQDPMFYLSGKTYDKLARIKRLEEKEESSENKVLSTKTWVSDAPEREIGLEALAEKKPHEIANMQAF
ncbi:MAG: hypothetical protein AB8E15_13035 [Bdellovibrionales bacterium]